MGGLVVVAHRALDGFLFFEELLDLGVGLLDQGLGLIGRIGHRGGIDRRGLGATAANPVLDTLKKFPGIYARRLHNTSHTPAFDMITALDTSRLLTGREDEGAYLERTDEH